MQAAVIGGMSYNKLVEKLLDFRSISSEGNKLDGQSVPGPSGCGQLTSSDESRDESERPQTIEGKEPDYEVGSQGRPPLPDAIDLRNRRVRGTLEGERREGSLVIVEEGPGPSCDPRNSSKDLSENHEDIHSSQVN